MQRRDFLKGIGAGALLSGVGITAEDLNNTDKSVIWLFCQGGMSGFESFTPKEDSFRKFFLSNEIPAITRGPSIEPRPASSIPQICMSFVVKHKY